MVATVGRPVSGVEVDLQANVLLKHPLRLALRGFYAVCPRWRDHAKVSRNTEIRFERAAIGVLLVIADPFYIALQQRFPCLFLCSGLHSDMNSCDQFMPTDTIKSVVGAEMLPHRGTEQALRAAGRGRTKNEFLGGIYV